MSLLPSELYTILLTHADLPLIKVWRLISHREKERVESLVWLAPKLTLYITPKTAYYLSRNYLALCSSVDLRVYDHEGNLGYRRYGDYYPPVARHDDLEAPDEVWRQSVLFRVLIDLSTGLYLEVTSTKVDNPFKSKIQLPESARARLGQGHILGGSLTDGYLIRSISNERQEIGIISLKLAWFTLPLSEKQLSLPDQSFSFYRGVVVLYVEQTLTLYYGPLHREWTDVIVWQIRCPINGGHTLLLTFKERVELYHLF